MVWLLHLDSYYDSQAWKSIHNFGRGVNECLSPSKPAPWDSHAFDQLDIDFNILASASDYF